MISLIDKTRWTAIARMRASCKLSELKWVDAFFSDSLALDLSQLGSARSFS